MTLEAEDSAGSRDLLDRIGRGESGALEELLARDRDFVRGIVALRLDPCLAPRLDISDVIQEAQMQIARRVREYLNRRPMPYRAWVRQTTLETILQARRRHLAACRDVNREGRLPLPSSLMIARQAADPGPSPLSHVLAAEEQELIHRAVSLLSEAEQEVLLMRTVEGLSNQEVAQVLNLEPAAASKRFGRALLSLRLAVGRIAESSRPSSLTDG